MANFHKALLSFGTALFALIILTGVASAHYGNYATPTPTPSPETPTPTCTPTPTPEDPTATPTPTCQLNGQGICIQIECDGGGDCEFTNTTPTPTPTNPTATPTPQAPSNPGGPGDGLSDGHSSGGSSSPTQAVLGASMAPTGTFAQDVMDFMLLTGVVILSVVGYKAYGKKKKA